MIHCLIIGYLIIMNKLYFTVRIENDGLYPAARKLFM